VAAPHVFWSFSEFLAPPGDSPPAAVIQAGHGIVD
jgi:hypothetical protein